MIHLLTNVKQQYRNWLETCYIASRVCYSKKKVIELDCEAATKENKELEEFLDKKIFSKGHWSIAEHVYLTFVMEDVSRSMTHQLVRHRHLSYSQKSQRYCKLEDNDFILIPKTMKDNKNVEMISNDLKEYILNVKNSLIDLGFKEEDIRFIYPNGTKTTIVVSANMRALIEVMNKRLCSRAQQEIRDEFYELKQQLEKYLPKGNIFTKYMVPKCKWCTEKKDCELGVKK
ncbi:MAG: FAD-dependent thymidylate synthase [Staphylococcus sp.]|nr:FAD-dependent thymidylate synthase [Staphylococcus sp.]